MTNFALLSYIITFCIAYYQNEGPYFSTYDHTHTLAYCPVYKSPPSSAYIKKGWSVRPLLHTSSWLDSVGATTHHFGTLHCPHFCLYHLRVRSSAMLLVFFVIHKKQKVRVACSGVTFILHFIVTGHLIQNIKCGICRHIQTTWRSYEPNYLLKNGS